MRRKVYFIKPIGMDGPIKIGCSVAPDNRRETLETWSPFPLEVCAEIEGDFGIERRFHTLFADSFIGREWFRCTPELQATIEAVRNGTFDLASLPVAFNLSRFRKPRTNSVYTPSWRYRASVMTRFQRRFSIWPYWNEEFKQIVGNASDLLPLKPQIEALIERLSAELVDRAA